MKKVLIGLLAIVFLLSMAPRPAITCCGMYPNITIDPFEFPCAFLEGTIQGTVWSEEIWAGYYSTTASVRVDILAPGGTLTQIIPPLTDLVEEPGPPKKATWSWSVDYTPEESGTYTVTVYAWWTTSYGTMGNSNGTTFDVVYCTTPGKVTGGGWIETPDGVRNTFGFNAQYSEKKGFSGNVEFQSHKFDNLHSTAITGLYIYDNNTKAIIIGECTINGEDGYTFVLKVEDNGEPGLGNDSIKISYGLKTIGPRVLDGGNIQIH